MDSLYQRHFEIQYAVKEIIYNFMQNASVSPLEMENALAQVLGEIKEKNYRNFLVELQNQAAQGEQIEPEEEKSNG